MNVLLAAVALIAQQAKSLEWNQWRGPNRDGISPDTGLLKQWPTGGPPLAWKTTGIGAGYSSVSFTGNLILTLGDLDGTCCLHALDSSDGKIVWQLKVAPAAKVDHPGVRSTPSTDGTLVWALEPAGALVCAEVKTGKEKWRKELKKDFGGAVGVWAYSESPLIDSKLLVCTPGGRQGAVLALDKETGQKVWQSSEFTDRAEYTSLMPAEIGGVRQYVVLTMQSVAGVSAKDGRLLWRTPRKGQTAVVATPVYHEGLVFVTSGYGVGCSAFKIGAQNGKFDVSEAYADPPDPKAQNKRIRNHHGGVILVGDYLYGVDDGGSIKCIEFKTGKEAWASPRLGKGSIACADGMIVYRSENRKNSTIALLEASPQGYKEKGRFNQPDMSGEMTWPHPIIFGGRLYIRDQNTLLCYDIKSK